MTDEEFVVAFFISAFILFFCWYIVFVVLLFISRKILGYFGSFLSENVRTKIKHVGMFLFAGCISSLVLMVFNGNNEITGPLSGVLILLTAVFA